MDEVDDLVAAALADDEAAQAEVDAALADDEAAQAELDALLSPVAMLRLEALQRHITTFAPSGIIDLSGRDIKAGTRTELDFAALGAAAAGVFCLDLSSNAITTIPPFLFRPLSGLQELSLAHNALEIFPAALCQLHSLRELDLSHNHLANIGASSEMFSSGLPALQRLDVSHNVLQSMPPCLLGCAALRTLDLACNRMEHSLPGADEAILGCTSLTSLSLRENGMLKGELATLREPQAGRPFAPAHGGPFATACACAQAITRRAPLLAAPPSIWRLPKIAVLCLAHNRIATISPCVGSLAGGLRALTVQHNGLRALPAALGQCAALQVLRFEEK